MFACDCPMNKCCICLHVWMAIGKINCKLTGSPSLSKVFELNLIELSGSTYPLYIKVTVWLITALWIHVSSYTIVPVKSVTSHNVKTSMRF